MKLSVCIDALFNGQDLESSMAVVKKSGINTIEFWDWASKDLELMVALLTELNMEVATFCTKSTSLVDPSQHESYLQGLSESIEVAKRLGVKKLIGLVGNDTGMPRGDQHNHLIEGLLKCVPILEEAGIVLMIEPLNVLIDHEGYYLSGSKEAFDIVKEVDSPYVRVLFDIYHQQITEGNLLNNIGQNLDLIGHIHTAGHPGRHELYLGEINYKEIFKKIRETNYEGYIGLEYFPTQDAKDGLMKTLTMTTTEVAL